MDVVDKIRESLRSDPDAAAVEYQGRTWSRGMIAKLAQAITVMLDEAGVGEGAPVGLVARNSPAIFSALVGLAGTGRSLGLIHPFQSPEKLASDIRALQFSAVIADEEDFTSALVEAVRDIGAVGVALDSSSGEAVARTVVGFNAGVPHACPLDEPGIEILSSGTTGPPKRLPLPYRTMERMVVTILLGRPEGSGGLDIVYAPLSVYGGAAGAIGNAALGRQIVLLQKFNVPEWVHAVRRHRPSYISLPAAGARMLLDADAPADALSSIDYVYGGGAPMTPELQREFEERFDLKVLWAYGATEFCGTVTNWTPELYRDFGAIKMGSIGRPSIGIGVRIVEAETGAPLPSGAVGLLEAQVPAIGDAWIRTTDLGSIDEDGFVFHHGRADSAIVRGGFKVIPEEIASVFREHPAVKEAVVVGLSDRRLGAVPVAALELRHDAADQPDAEALSGFARTRLPANQIPAQVRIVEALPRNANLKVDLNAVKALFERDGD